MQRHHHDPRTRIKRSRARLRAHICSYISISISLVIMVLYVIDLYKQGDMAFMNNPYTFFMAFSLSVLSVVNGISLIVYKNRCARLQKENARIRKKYDRDLPDDD